ncbi:MAG: hypothetical protein F2923_08085 [Actinobacteria bacterium]|uniref:Unannotated protein n=1 Tax=freshwater metagenome TaxID=449393 RepID=A0A6J7SME6_9ZZZZ|nr:hypothetical protein [Actinomycetota bacterium]
MNPFMVVCTYQPNTDMAEVVKVIPQEQAIAKSLQEAGRLGAIHLALPRGTVFLEVFAHDLDAAQATVLELPMSKWWDLDIFPLVRPH